MVGGAVQRHRLRPEGGPVLRRHVQLGGLERRTDLLRPELRRRRQPAAVPDQALLRARPVQQVRPAGSRAAQRPRRAGRGPGVRLPVGPELDRGGQQPEHHRLLRLPAHRDRPGALGHRLLPHQRHREPGDGVEPDGERSHGHGSAPRAVDHHLHLPADRHRPARRDHRLLAGRPVRQVPGPDRRRRVGRLPGGHLHLLRERQSELDRDRDRHPPARHRHRRLPGPVRRRHRRRHRRGGLPLQRLRRPAVEHQRRRVDHQRAHRPVPGGLQPGARRRQRGRPLHLQRRPQPAVDPRAAAGGARRSARAGADRDRHQRQRAATARPGHHRVRLDLVRLRRGQVRGELRRCRLPGHPLLQQHRPDPLDAAGPRTDPAAQRRPRPEPGGRTPQGHLQPLDAHLCDVHAHRQQLLLGGQGRRRDQCHPLRPLRLPGQLPAARIPEP